MADVAPNLACDLQVWRRRPGWTMCERLASALGAQESTGVLRNPGSLVRRPCHHRCSTERSVGRSLGRSHSIAANVQSVYVELRRQIGKGVITLVCPEGWGGMFPDP
jgi:hypothetical protein